MIHYFENCATTRVDDDIAELITQYHTEKYFNPSARSSFSLNIANEIAASRENISQALNGGSGEIYFTSGGTEADNLAILGSLRSRRGNIVVTEAEHAAVYNVVSQLSNKGYEIRYAAVLPDGHIDVNDFVSKVDDETLLACFIHVNNETGAVNNIKLLNSLVKEKNSRTVTFSDGVQAVGKIPVNLRHLAIDLYSFAGHKIHCTKGIGALYVKNGVRLVSTVYGGGQEKGLRSGTEYVGGIAALSVAVERATKLLSQNAPNFQLYKETIRNALQDVAEWKENCTQNVSPAIMSLAFSGIKGEVLLHLLEKYDIIVGTGSACSSKNKQSRIAKAIGLGDDFAEGVIRISFSKYNNLEEVNLLADKLCQCVKELRKTMHG